MALLSPLRRIVTEARLSADDYRSVLQVGVYFALATACVAWGTAMYLMVRWMVAA